MCGVRAYVCGVCACVCVCVYMLGEGYTWRLNTGAKVLWFVIADCFLLFVF